MRELQNYPFSMELAKMAVHNALLEKNEMRTSLIIPRCTYTDPETDGLLKKDFKKNPFHLQCGAQNRIFTHFN